MVENTSLKRLAWDSEFWGVNFYDLVGSSELNFDEIQKPYLIQKKVEKTNIADCKKLEVNGYQCVEQKITLLKQVENEHNTCVDIRPIKLSEVENLKDEIGLIFVENSRYRMFDVQDRKSVV